MAHFEFHPGVITASAHRLYSRFRRAFREFNIFYSVKTNWHPLVVQEIHAAGGYFEITSAMEWNKVAHLRPSRIVVNGPAKSPRVMSEILASGVRDLVLNLDNDTDIEQLGLFRSLSPVVRLGLRVFLDKEDVWTRFGYSADAVVSNGATRHAMDHVQGFHFHFSTKNYSLHNYHELSEKIVRITGAEGWRLAFIDIGGGLPCAEDITDSELDDLVRTLHQLFGSEIEVMSEVGRFLVESSMSCVAEIVSVKRLDDMRYDIAIDTNVCHLPCYWQRRYGIQFQSTPPRPSQPARVNVFGNSCMQLDCFAEDFPVEHVPRPGDRLRLSRMGAYSLSQASPFITEIPYVKALPI